MADHFSINPPSAGLDALHLPLFHSQSRLETSAELLSSSIYIPSVPDETTEEDIQSLFSGEKCKQQVNPSFFLKAHHHLIQALFSVFLPPSGEC